jgi:hypothetical protein
MKLRCRRGATPIALKILPLAIFAGVALLSRSAPTQAPAEPGPGPMRAIGAVHPRLSPDGKSIVFSYQGSIWRLPSEGGTMKRLAAGPGFAVEPCWSADGRRIAYLEGRPWGSGQVKLIDSQTGAALPMPAAILGTGKLHFAPDGTQLLGHLRTAKQLDALRTLDLKSGELKSVIKQRASRLPWALSRDGKWIAHVTTLDEPEEQMGNFGPQNDLWKVSVDGGEPVRIVRFPARIYDVCWSADGKALFVTTNLGGVHNDIQRIDLSDPERPVKLTFGQADEDRPSVSADGRWLLYNDNHEGAPALVLRDLGTHETRTLPIQRLDFGSPTGRLRLKAIDKAAGKELVTRLAVESKDGGFHAPPGALWRIDRDHAHFFATDSVEFDLPAGTYRLRASHGPEYRVLRAEVEIKPGAVAEQTLALERWVDANARGWYCGDNHIHANYGYGEYYNSPASMAAMCAGEGLNACNFMVANSDGDGVFDREYFRGRPDPLSTRRTVLYWNEEWRSTIWGHMTLVNLKQVVEPVFTGFKDTTNPYDIPSVSEIADRTHRQGGLVNYTHPSARIDDLYRGAYTAKGLPIYAALGKIDTLDVMGSNEQATSALYHRLLNCGFRLTASAGTDCFLNRIRSRLPGIQRVYVKTKEPFTYAGWIEGLRAGRSFVSNGPFVEFAVDGKGVGDVVELRAAKEVKVQAAVTSPFPLTRIEVLYNGKAVATGEPAKTLTTELTKSIALEQSGWLALRVVGPAHADVEGVVYAHTSPVYVTVAGKPAGSAEDAKYFLAWIDRLWETVQERDRIPSPQEKAAVQAQVEQARGVYRKIVER